MPLIARRLADGGDVRFKATDTSVDDVTGDRPTIRFTHDGQQHQLDCDFVIGCDGSRTCTRFLIPEGDIRTDFFRQYPFAWSGILADAWVTPPSPCHTLSDGRLDEEDQPCRHPR
ncbi:FAD-dependent monooxygenase [Pseudonocardia bannensis]|uniref:FAD-binding domain-containing protein n=1 Tax=Pseudonocardia bannensis TaxID=630973 RepID=A0A848DCS2_9PSEU|nr:FAD-dependent monooxygenase [Pseudonocardia bannensis]NMH90385.1 hypothetical protein [Pseudonocardia bannensis]